MGQQYPAHIVVDFSTIADQHEQCAAIVTDPDVKAFHQHLAARYRLLAAELEILAQHPPVVSAATPHS